MIVAASHGPAAFDGIPAVIGEDPEFGGFNSRLKLARERSGLEHLNAWRYFELTLDFTLYKGDHRLHIVVALDLDVYAQNIEIVLCHCLAPEIVNCRQAEHEVFRFGMIYIEAANLDEATIAAVSRVYRPHDVKVLEGNGGIDAVLESSGAAGRRTRT